MYVGDIEKYMTGKTVNSLAALSALPYGFSHIRRRITADLVHTDH